MSCTKVRFGNSRACWTSIISQFKLSTWKSVTQSLSAVPLTIPKGPLGRNGRREDWKLLTADDVDDDDDDKGRGVA